MHILIRKFYCQTLPNIVLFYPHPINCEQVTDAENIKMNIMRLSCSEKTDFAYANTKMQISCAVTYLLHMTEISSF